MSWSIAPSEDPGAAAVEFAAVRVGHARRRAVVPLRAPLPAVASVTRYLLFRTDTAIARKVIDNRHRARLLRTVTGPEEGSEYKRYALLATRAWVLGVTSAGHR